jgi:hypothetical protein
VEAHLALAGLYLSLAVTRDSQGRRLRKHLLVSLWLIS